MTLIKLKLTLTNIGNQLDQVTETNWGGDFIIRFTSQAKKRVRTPSILERTSHFNTNASLVSAWSLFTVLNFLPFIAFSYGQFVSVTRFYVLMH